jgi:hypothetical protein
MKSIPRDWLSKRRKCWHVANWRRVPGVVLPALPLDLNRFVLSAEKERKGRKSFPVRLKEARMTSAEQQ